MDGFDLTQKWTKDRYDEFLKRLRDMGEEEYKKFSLKLIPGETKAFGVRLPELRKIAKGISKGDGLGFISVCGEGFLEELMLRGFVVANIKDSVLCLEETKKFVPFIRNWSVCDSFSASLKIAKKKPEVFLPFVWECVENDGEFTKRFGIVMLMDHFVDEEHIEDILDAYERIKSEDYYVKMALAWGISVCFVKFPKNTMRIIERGSLDEFTHNKAIQKICESFRVSKEDKEFLKKLKK